MRNKWPFKTLEPGDTIKLESGYNGKTVEQIRRQAITYAKIKGIKITTAKQSNCMVITRTQ